MLLHPRASPRVPPTMRPWPRCTWPGPVAPDPTSRTTTGSKYLGCSSSTTTLSARSTTRIRCGGYRSPTSALTSWRPTGAVPVLRDCLHRTVRRGRTVRVAAHRNVCPMIADRSNPTASVTPRHHAFGHVEHAQLIATRAALPMPRQARSRTCWRPSWSTALTPTSCMVRRISASRISTALATPRSPPAISPYR